MDHIRALANAVDLFIAPSRYLLTKFRDEFGLPEEKLVYLDYGFHLKRLRGRSRLSGEPFTFGYIGTHIPAKGIHQLIEGFARVSGDALLRIWGRHRGAETEALMAQAETLLAGQRGRVQWMGEYRNDDIVSDVFNRCDALVVPSIWAENSPLVIHEALQTGVPVVTADFGGMAEYVHHQVNGLLFEHRNPEAMSRQMQRFVDEPALAEQLGKRGYLQSPTGNVPDMVEHAKDIEELYARVIKAG